MSLANLHGADGDPSLSQNRKYNRHPLRLNLVAEWIHFTLLGIIRPTLKQKVYTFGGLMNSATRLMWH